MRSVRRDSTVVFLLLLESSFLASSSHSRTDGGNENPDENDNRRSLLVCRNNKALAARRTGDATAAVTALMRSDEPGIPKNPMMVWYVVWYVVWCGLVWYMVWRAEPNGKEAKQPCPYVFVYEAKANPNREAMRECTALD